MSRKKKTEASAAPWGLPLFALYAGVLAALGFGLSWLVELAGFPPSPGFSDPLAALPAAIAWLVAALGAAALVCRLEKRPLQEIGFSFHEGMYLHLGLGLAVAIAAGLLSWAVADLAGAVTTSVDDLDAAALLRDGARVLLLIFALAAVEELIFRSALQGFLARRLSTFQAVLCSSLIFAIAHGVMRPDAPTLGLAGVAVAGGMLGLAYARTGSLWLPLGLHAGWNVAVGFVTGLPVSGFTFGTTILRTESHGHALLTGGAYGPEASVPGLLALAVGLAAIRWLPVDPAKPVQPPAPA